MIGRVIFLTLALLLVVAASARATTAAWIVMGPHGRQIARAIIDGPSPCPSLTIDGAEVAMTRLHGPLPDFPVTVCTADLPAAATSVNLGLLRMPSLPARVRRIALLGDTGCRIKAGRRPQNCDDPEAWPFGRIAERIALSNPDLIIHVGDYHYREAPCTEDLRCANAAWGDNWKAWDQDFFTPGHMLFEAAPLILLRGNHEDCAHAPRGWFMLLDPRGLDVPEGACDDVAHVFSGTYEVPIGGLTLLVADSSGIPDDRPVRRREVNELAQQIDFALAGIAGPVWLLTHRPPFSVSMPLPGNPPRYLGGVDGMQRVMKRVETPAIDLILSGDLHLFQAVDLGPRWPRQMIVGIGGDRLAALPTKNLAGLQIINRHFEAMVKDGYSHHAFGYVIFERGEREDLWQVTLHDTEGSVVATCDLAPDSVTCKPI